MADMSPHVSTVFKELFDEIKSTKQQQWTITNYGLLILAAIYAVRQQFPEVPHSQSKLKFLAIATAVVGSGLLLRIQSHMASHIWRDHAPAWRSFTGLILRQMNLVTLASLLAR
jgi:hypothetical protein